MGEVLNLLWQVFVGFVTSFIRLFRKPAAKSIHGEIALVTGAGHGMGKLYCIKLAKLGATIIAVDVNESTNTDTLAILKQMRAKAYGYTVDLRDKMEIRKLAAKIKEDVGDVTMLVNNAGVIYPTDILSLTDKMITNTFEVNILSHFWLIKEFLPSMKSKNHGHIIAMASYTGLFGTAYMTDYSSTKHAVVGLMEGLRNELRRQNICGVKLTCICPSFVTTGLLKNIRANLNVPILEPEFVVNQAVQALLRDEFLVTVPSGCVPLLMKALLPRAVNDALLDFVRTEVDLINDD